MEKSLYRSGQRTRFHLLRGIDNDSTNYSFPVGAQCLGSGEDFGTYHSRAVRNYDSTLFCKWNKYGPFQAVTIRPGRGR